MSTENLKVVITGDASGLDKTSAQAAASISKVSQSAAEWDARARALNLSTNYASRSFAKLGTSAVASTKTITTSLEKTSAGSIRTQYALSDLSRGLEGFGSSTSQGINGIARFAHEFTYLQQQAGSTKGAFKLLKESIAGPIGIVFALGALAEIVTGLISKYGSLGNAINALSGDATQQEKNQQALDKAFSDGAKSMESSIKGLFSVQNAVDLASKGYISANTAISLFNKTLGSTLGNVNSLAEAQNKLNSKSSAYITATVDKAVATQLLGQASDEVTKNLKLQAKADDDAATGWQKLGNFFKAFAEHPFDNIGSALAFGQANAVSGVKTKAKSQADTEAQVKSLKDLAQQQSEAASKLLKTIFNPDAGGKGGGNLSIVADVLAKLTANLQAADSKAVIFGASIEQVGAMKMKALSDAMNSLAKISTPAAIAEAKKLGAEYDQIAKSSFLPTLTGGRAGVNAPAGISGNPGVPTYINPNVAPGLNTNSQKVATAQQKLLNDQFRQSMQLGRQMESVFSGVFQAIEQGGNPFQAMIQAVEHLIAKLAEAAAVAAVLSLLSGGTANAAAGGISFLTAFKGLTHFATGGYIPSPQLAIVGDAPGGEWVLNQKQISAILNGAGGGRNVAVTGEFRLVGNDLVAAVNNTNMRNGRVNG